MARELVTRERIERFLREMGRRYRGSGRIYLTGGSEMVFLGFRRQTEDIDYVVDLDGDDREFTTAIRSLIGELDLSVEPAGPGDFIPLPRGWEERSSFIGRHDQLNAYLFDPISTVLSKIARGTSRDVEDAIELEEVEVSTIQPAHPLCVMCGAAWSRSAISRLHLRMLPAGSRRNLYASTRPTFERSSRRSKRSPLVEPCR